MSNLNILVINPGSTSTKIALFKNEEEILTKNLSHSSEDLAKYEKITEEYPFREEIILDALKEIDFDPKNLSAVVGRGGLLRPIPSGTFKVNEEMIKDLKEGIRGEHASNLGGILAFEIAKIADCPSFIVDPVVVDEMEEIARLSGNPNIPRLSIFHALNQKSVARKAAADLGKSLNEVNLIIAHMGGGISIGIHSKGSVIDVNNALDGEGPFTPERSGGLPSGGLAKLCFSGKYSEKEIKSQIKGQGGLVAYLGTNDARKVEEMIEAGDEKAKLVYKAMAYQVSKEIGLLATVVKGQVDGIVLSGGLAYGKSFTDMITERVSWIANVMIYPGEKEMEPLRDGALRVLKGEEEAKEY
ncbi:MAG: butyrate kinase [Pseudomonadota bacterium]